MGVEYIKISTKILFRDERNTVAECCVDDGHVDCGTARLVSEQH